MRPKKCAKKGQKTNTEKKYVSVGWVLFRRGFMFSQGCEKGTIYMFTIKVNRLNLGPRFYKTFNI